MQFSTISYFCQVYLEIIVCGSRPYEVIWCVYTSRLRMRLTHCVAFFYNLPWLVVVYEKKKLLLRKRNTMRKTHAETGCGNSALFGA